jgi:hypothetical protein
MWLISLAGITLNRAQRAPIALCALAFLSVKIAHELCWIQAGASSGMR